MHIILKHTKFHITDVICSFCHLPHLRLIAVCLPLPSAAAAATPSTCFIAVVVVIVFDVCGRTPDACRLLHSVMVGC